MESERQQDAVTQIRCAVREFGDWLIPAAGAAFVVAAIAMMVGQHLILDVWMRGAVVVSATAFTFAAHAHYRLVKLTEVPNFD